MRHLRKENQILARKSSFASRNHWANIADGRNWPTLAGPRSAARDPFQSSEIAETGRFGRHGGRHLVLAANGLLSAWDNAPFLIQIASPRCMVAPATNQWPVACTRKARPDVTAHVRVTIPVQGTTRRARNETTRDLWSHRL